MIKTLIKPIIYPFIFFFGIIYFFVTKKNFMQGFASLRYLFVMTNGKINNVSSKVISFFIPKYKITKAGGVLGDLSKNDIENIVSDIETNGFHVFENKLKDTDVNDLVRFASETKVSYLDFNQKHIAYSKEKVLFDEKSTLSPRFQFNNQELFENDTIKKLVFDNSLLAIANSYLNTKPILDLAVMWWSIPFDSKAENKAAQMYHFDMDRFKFIKFFFYLNDVTTNNGPHCYVRASHKKLPKAILADRRIKDEEIKELYPQEDILELIGEKGSIIAVDTRGLHKGKPLINGKRLLFQIEFSNFLFGASYNTVNNVKLDSKSFSLKKEYMRTYRLIG
jgi:hypothetical protein